MKKKKALSPVVSVGLLLVLAVFSVVGFQGWFGSYSSGLFTKAEIQTDDAIEEGTLVIETLIGSTLYVKNGVTDNLTIKNLKIDGVECNITGAENLSLGITEIDVRLCLLNVSTTIPEIVLITDRKLISEKIFIKDFPMYFSCSLDGLNVEHSQIGIFYNSSKVTSTCYSEQRTCNDGVLNGSDSYNYSSCSLLFGSNITLDNPNNYSTTLNDSFGSSVSVSDNYALVGAVWEDDASGNDSGKAYIFNVSSGSLLRTLDNPNNYSTSANDSFGSRVSVSGDYALVGAYFEDDAGGNSSGKVYIFNVSSGSLLRTLNNPNNYSTSADDNFGFSVSVSGDYALVGAYLEDDAGGSNSGKAYIFNVSSGSLLRTLNNPNIYGTSTSDNFGYSVSVSGDYALVGALFESDAGGIGSGKAYIFNVSNGSLLRTLVNPNNYSTSQLDLFGSSVSVSGNYALVGAYFEDDAGGNSSGKAYIFNVSSGSLLRTLDNPNNYSTSASDFFGSSVSVSDNYALVGAFWEDDASGNDSGKAYIFNVSSGSLLRTLDNPNNYSTSASDFFGSSVSVSGNYALVGAVWEDDASGNDSGKAYIFIN